MNGMPTAFRASRMATDVWVYAPIINKRKHRALTSINDYPVNSLSSRLVNTVNDVALMVALEGGQPSTLSFGSCFRPRFNVG